MNEWLVIPLTVVFFVIVACVILAIAFGGWTAAHWAADRLARAVPIDRLRRGETGTR